MISTVSDMCLLEMEMEKYRGSRVWVVLSGIPFPSFAIIWTISPLRTESSLERSLLKSYKTLAVSFLAAGGAAGGGGGGGARACPEVFLVWLEELAPTGIAASGAGRELIPVALGVAFGRG